MKNFINRMLSTYTSYDLKKLHDTINKKINMFLINLKYYGVDKTISIFEKYSYWIIIFLAIIFTILFNNEKIFIAGVAITSILLNILYKYTEFQRDRFLLRNNSNNGIDELDKLIQDCLTEYAIFNNYEGIKYINDKEEDKIKTELATMISTRLSVVLFKKLCLIYNENSVYDIIGVRISIIVMNYAIEINRQKDAELPASSNQMSTIPFLQNININK